MTTNDPLPEPLPSDEPPQYVSPPVDQAPGASAPVVMPASAGSAIAQPTLAGFPAARQSDETVWALLAHLSFFVISLIGPLIIMLVAGDQRPFARAHAVEALNFHITLWIAAVISIILIFVVIGLFTLIAVAVIGVVFTILAAIKAGQGEGYRYPLTLRLVK